MEGKLARGTPVDLLHPLDGSTCRLRAAEVAVSRGGGECTVLTGDCPPNLELALVGGHGEFEAVALRLLTQDARARAVEKANSLLPSLKPHEWCSPGASVSPPTVSEVVQVLGEPTLVLVQYAVRHERTESNGPLIAVSGGRAVSLGFPGSRVAAFRLGGVLYLWTARTGLACGARLDALHRADKLDLAVFESGFLSN